jgi:hypothetical protein
MLLAAAGLGGCALLEPDERPAIEGVYVGVMNPADTLVFGDDQTGVRVRAVEAAGPGGGITSYRDSFTYRGVDDFFEVTYVCPPNASCAAGPHYRARLVQDELLLDPAYTESSEPRTRFRRAGL